MEYYEWWMGWVTWIEKDGPHLLPSRRQLDHSEARTACGVIVIIHWDVQVPAFQVGIRGIRGKALTTPPGDLRRTQRGRRATIGREELTDASLRAVAAGAATARLASKPRASRTVKPLGWIISLVGAFQYSEA